MSGNYTFDPSNDRVDEVPLVANNDSAVINCSTSKWSVTIIILQIVILALLVVLIGLSVFNTVQGSNPSVCNTPTSDSNQCSCNSTQITESLKAVQDVHQQTIYNSTDVLARLLNWLTIYNQNSTDALVQLLNRLTIYNENSTDALAQLLHQQTIYNQNSTDILVQLLRAAISEQNNTGNNIIQLLQDIHTDQMMFSQNNTDMQNLILQYSENSLQKLINIVGSLSNLKTTSINTAAVIDDVLLVVEKLSQLQNASALFNSITPVSCKDIKTALPSSPTGYYHVPYLL